MTNGDGKWHTFAEDHSISPRVLETIREMVLLRIVPAKKRFEGQENAYQRLLATLGRKDKEKTTESEHKSVERS